MDLVEIKYRYYPKFILLAYNIPKCLVVAIMSLYKGAQVKVSTQFRLSDEPIDLSVGVLQGDTLAPYLFIIVIDYIMRNALKDKKHLGFQLTSSSSSNMLKSNPKSHHITRNRTGSRTQSVRFNEQIIPDTFLADLEFADDVTLLSSPPPLKTSNSYFMQSKEKP